MKNKKLIPKIVGASIVLVFFSIILFFGMSNLELEQVNVSQYEKTLVIFPIFTQTAYSENGFYSYYEGKCDEKCLTVKIGASPLTIPYATSINGFQILRSLGYAYVSDIQVDQDPSILKDYDKIILLHNEYVTKKEFDAITNHPKVVYLYPNALYAEIDINYTDDSITLLRGHGYPEILVSNGFEWEFDNTHPYESDKECLEWKFYNITNGYMLNCYPENIIYSDVRLLETIKDL